MYAYPRLVESQPTEIPSLNLYAPHPRAAAVSCTHLDAGKGAWPATDAAAGAIEREALSAVLSAWVGTTSNLTSLVPVGPGTQIRRDVRAGLAAGGRTTPAVRDQARWPDPPVA